MNKLKILKMKDESDKYAVEKGLLFNVPFRLLLIMKTGGGKSNFIGNLFRDEFYGKEFKGEDIYIISPMINDNKLNSLIDFKNIPEDNVMTSFDGEVISALYDKLTEEFAESVEKKKKPVQSVIIMDDISWSGKLRQGSFNIVNKIFCNGRKHNISIILTSQFYNHILPSCRSQASGIILGNTSEKQLKFISDDNNYLEGGDKSFRSMFRKYVVEKHDFLVINYSNKFKDMYLDKDFNVISKSSS
tara:strand:+ start:10796 stop:11530 length:735 start_codon:yes stop_codon:yes gene_type:complete